MMGFGLLLVVCLSVFLLMGVLVIGAWLFNASRSGKLPAYLGYQPVPTGSMTRTCAQCSSALQPDWTHCPKCGAPVNR